MRTSDIHHPLNSTSLGSTLAYHHTQSHSKVNKNDTDKTFLYARALLFILGTSYVVISLFTVPSVIEGWTQICLGVIIVIFGFAASRNPFMSLMIPLILLSLNYLGDLIIDPATFTSWKSVFLSSFIFGTVLVKLSVRK